MTSCKDKLISKNSLILFNKDSNEQYNDLSLYPNRKCFGIVNHGSGTKINSSKLNTNIDFSERKDFIFNPKGSLNLWHEHNNRRYSNFMHDGKILPNQKDVVDDASVYKSTLSLHISAYENDSEQSSNDTTKTDSSKKLKSSNIRDYSKFIAKITSPFEIPRQQENVVGEPEVAQFRARQRVLNPNKGKRFSPQEKAQCVLWFNETKCPTQVQRNYRREYGLNARAPEAKTIKKWFDIFQERGSVLRKERTNTRWVTNEETVQDVLELFASDPHASVRRAANELEIPKTTVHRVLQKFKWHPYKIQILQQLLPLDLQLRVQFCEQQLALKAAQPLLFQQMIWSDEANFHVCGGVNKQDFRYWSPENPHFHAEKPLHSPKVTVWAGISYFGIYGPYFFHENVNGVNYLEMLQNYFVPRIQTHPEFGMMVFQQDGAPAHYANPVTAFLNATFPNRWIGRGSPNMPWPPRSPDITCCDFYLWGAIKAKVYREPIRDIEHLKERIAAAFAEIDQETMLRVIQDYERRLHYCIEVGGRSVEMDYDD